MRRIWGKRITFLPDSKHPVRFSLTFGFEPRDLWVGLFWNTGNVDGETFTAYYVCLLPMLPISVLVPRTRHDENAPVQIRKVP